MRKFLLLAVLVLGGCTMHMEAETSSPLKPGAAQVQRGAPGSAEAALAPYYARLKGPMPYAGNGPALPAADTVLTHIDFGSCNATFKPIPILSTIAEDKPQLFLYLGDNVYGDAKRGNAALPELRQTYDQLSIDDDFRKLRTSVPFMETWDDHDFGLNDAGGDFAFKQFSQELYRYFWGIPADDPRRSHDGVYYAKTFGVDGKRVQIIMLDTRFFRSGRLEPTDEYGAPGKERYLPSYDPDMTMLGDAQWKWFAEELQKPADIRFVVTSIQALAIDHGWEAWKEMMPQRDKLFEVIRDSKQNGVMLLSGDRHIAAFYKKTGETDYPLYEFTSSALNMSFTDNATEMDSLQLVKAYGPNNFGTILIDWDEHKVTWQIRDEEGRVQRELNIPFSDIGKQAAK